MNGWNFTRVERWIDVPGVPSRVLVTVWRDGETWFLGVYGIESKATGRRFATMQEAMVAADEAISQFGAVAA